ISPKRTYNQQSFYTNFQIYAQAEDARIIVKALKLLRKETKARIVNKKNVGALIYFDEDTFNLIKNKELNVPNIEEANKIIEELKTTKKGRAKKSSRAKAKPKPKAKPKEKATARTTTVKGLKKSTQKKIDKGIKKKKIEEGAAKSSARSAKRDKSKSKLVVSDAQKEKKLESQYPKFDPNIPETFMDYYYEIPKYLLARVSPEANKIMAMRLLEIEKIGRKKLDKYIEILRSEQIKYDITFEKEKRIIDYMITLSKFLENKRNQLAELEAQKFYENYLITPLKNGKFAKQLSLIDLKGIDEVAYLIFKKIKGKLKKYPFSETILLRKIKEIIKENTKK
ncbi:MAG: hypothetical protein ACTSXF_15240, partial [Promethearchaeota archaeon]